MNFTLFILLSLVYVVSVSAQDHVDNVSGPFETPQEVTEECLMCHDEAGEEILASRHWNWLGSNLTDTTVTVGSRGKKNLINNFCIAVPSNYPRCTSCHISYGWKDENFDFDSPENIDCLVCHEQTGTYVKIPTGAGMPDSTIDLLTIAQSVGSATRRNCGTCHFDGGGGTGVKHGDMDNSLYNPTEEIDFHMGGLEFECTDCHETENHQIAGGSHGSMAEGENLISCEDCHDSDPHEKELLNEHYTAVACETCHIPSFAREEPTIIWWDWSMAGEERETVKNEFGKDNYNKKKGEFVWAKNVIPEYFWHNGQAEYYEIGETIDDTELLKLNRLSGSISDPSSKISPFKVMRGRQPFDPENKYLIIPNLYGEKGYWKTFDWTSAAEIGMEEVDLEFSGSVDFIETEMYWPINHMVMPAVNAINCTSCHGKGGENRLDWNALGYPDDPLKKGTREENNLIKQ